MALQKGLEATTWFAVDQQIPMQNDNYSMIERVRIEEETMRETEKKSTHKLRNLSSSPGNFTCKLPEQTKYLMVLSVWEQFSGARQVIADALAIAKRLRMTFVEPVIRNGYVVNPFMHSEEELIPLRMMMDVDAMKDVYPNWIGIEDFMSSCAAGGRGMPRMHIEHGFNLAPSAKKIQHMQESKEQVVAMIDFWRKYENHKAFVSSDGVPMGNSKEIARKADEIRRSWGNGVDYACVQWRQEGMKLNLERKMQCAHRLLEVVLPVIKNKKVLLLSDVRENSSDTSSSSENATEMKRCAEFLQDQLRFEELLQPLRAIKDTGVQALVEMELCATSPILVSCPPEDKSLQCTSCSRMDSKFADLTRALHDDLGLPSVITW